MISIAFNHESNIRFANIVSLIILFTINPVVLLGQISEPINKATIEQTEDSIDSKPCIIERRKYQIKANRKGKLRKRKRLEEISLYDKNGKVVKWESYNSSKGIVSTKIGWEHDYENNMLTERRQYYENALLEIIRYQYDSTGKRITKNYFTAAGRLIKSKDVSHKQSTIPIKIDSTVTLIENGKSIYERYNKSGELISKDSVVKDDVGRIIEHELMLNSYSHITSSSYSYLETGRVENIVTSSKSGEVIKIEIKEFDTYDLIKQINHYSDKNILRSQELFEYVYCQ